MTGQRINSHQSSSAKKRKSIKRKSKRRSTRRKVEQVSQEELVKMIDEFNKQNEAEIENVYEGRKCLLQKETERLKL